MRTGKKGDSSKGGIVFGLIFAVIFMGAGGAFMWFMGLKPLVLSQQSYAWNETACTVTKSDVKSSHTDDGTVYKAVINVTYSVGNLQYTGGSYSFNEMSSSGYSAKKEIVDNHPVGSQHTCYVNPDNAEQIVINRDIPGVVWIIIPFCSLFLLVGGFVLAATLNWLPENWTQTRHKRVSTSSVGLSTLKPRYSKKAKVIGSLCVMLFWNGIVSIFAYQAYRGFATGDPEWFLTLFITPFIAVGLFLVWGFVASVLASFNPTAVLSVSEGSPRLGQKVYLEWRFDGRTDRIDGLSVTLQAVEKATYKVGTDTRTEEHVFHSQQLVADEAGYDPERGSLSFDLPKNSMHSFEASNNAIEWVIKLRADIARWADIEDEYPLIVRPLHSPLV